MDSQDYLEVSVIVPDEQSAEIIVAQVSDLGFDSFFYEDGVQKCYIQRDLFDEEALGSVLRETEQFLPTGISWSVVRMPQVDWNKEWEESGFTPIECGGFVVTPYGNEPDGTLEPIYLDPHMAFGTGHHQTTYMMMESMQAIRDDISDASVVDFGCGTAVLAILAAKLGAAELTAIDIDETAVRSARENIRINGLSFEPVCGDSSMLKQGAYDVILANIHRNIIIEYMEVFQKSIRKGGKLLVSGFLEADVNDILSAASEHGFHPACDEFGGIRSNGGWVCITLVSGTSH